MEWPKLTATKIKSLKIKLLYLPIVYFVILLIVFVFTLRFGFQKINNEKIKLVQATKTESILLEKLNTLEDSRETLSTLVGVSSLALPEENPSLLSISQAKVVADSNLVNLESFKIGGELKGKRDYFSSEMLFEVGGDFFGVISMVEQMLETLPVVTIENLKIANNVNFSSAEFTVQNYWSDFPTNIPKISEPTVKLEGGDIEVLTKLSEYRSPLFNKLEPQGPTLRLDPFN